MSKADFTRQGSLALRFGFVDEDEAADSWRFVATI